MVIPDDLDAFERAAADSCSGASRIEKTLVDELLKVRRSWVLANLHQGARILTEAKPTMANLSSLTREIASALSVDEVLAVLEARRHKLEAIPAMLARTAVPLLIGFERLVTVSRSSSVAAVLGGLQSAGWAGDVVVFDGSPLGRGDQAAEELEVLGINVHSQPDAVAPTWLESEGRKLAVVSGADSISDRRFINAAGTRTLFELADRRGVDRLVVAESAKLGDDAGFEEMLSGQRVVSETGHGRSWCLFEAVPLSLVSAWVNEHGVFRNGEVRRTR